MGANAISFSVSKILIALVFLGAASLLPIFGSSSTFAFSPELTSDDLDAVDPNLIMPMEESSPGSAAGQSQTLDPVSNLELQIAELQILLDRSGLSPGAVNGQVSDHLDRVTQLFRLQNGLDALSAGDEKVSEFLDRTGGSAFQEYEITNEDVQGPFVAEIPKRIQDQGSLKKLNFMRVEELLGEKFHMDETFLRRLNPNSDFTKAGTVIKVANIGRYLDIKVSRILAEQDLKQVTAYDSKGRIVAVYPASIGSLQNPSPRGEFTVRNKAGFPAYTLAPDNGFEVMDSNQQVLVAPGPNNPVGIAWIGLSKKTFGIHGTPEPSQIGKSSSNGCIRLTNWDALELAKLVSTGVEVSIR